MRIIKKQMVWEKYTELLNMLQSISTFIPEPKLHGKIFDQFRNHKNQQSITLYDEDELVGFGVIVYEYKLRGGIVGHIEDIVVKDKYKGKGIGKRLIEELIKLGRKKKCYKYTLACSKENIGFYESCGFKINGINMSFLESNEVNLSSKETPTEAI